MAINKVPQGTKEAIARKSAKLLPNNPSARGMTADQIKKAFWAPVTDTAESVLAEIDRVVEEANNAIDASNAAIVAEEDARIAAIDAANTAIKAEEDERIAAINDANAQTQAVADALVVEIETRKNADSEHGADYRALERRVDAEEEATEAANTRLTSLDTRLTSIATELSGKARSYVLEDLEDLKALLTGRWEIGNGVDYYVEDLITGDNILIVQKDVPDFWFEATTDTDRRADTYTYTNEEGNEETVYLRVLGYDNGGMQVGLLHILESDYTVIEGYSKSASAAAQEAQENASRVHEAVGDVGDIEAALDAIIAIQESLIGGRA